MYPKNNDMRVTTALSILLPCATAKRKQSLQLGLNIYNSEQIYFIDIILVC
jgi:hypothetical protein